MEKYWLPHVKCSQLAVQECKRYIFNQCNIFHSFKRHKKKNLVAVVKSEPYLNCVGVLKGGDTVIGDITTFTGYENCNTS